MAAPTDRIAPVRPFQPGGVVRVAPRARLAVRLAGAVLTAAVAAGCASVPVPLPGGRQLATRMVARKADENTLVADDGGQCRVGADAFAKVAVGDPYRCVWRDPDYRVSAPTDELGATPSGPAQPQGGRRPGRP